MKAAGRQGRPSAPSARFTPGKTAPHRAGKPLATITFFPFVLLLSALWVCSFVRAAPQASTSSSRTGQNATASSGSGNSTNTTVVPLGTRAHHGLGQDWMQVNSIYIGFLPDWSRENPIDINRELGKAMAIIGDYIDIYEDDLSLSQAQYHSSAVLRLQGLSVYAPAIRPRFTLDKWTDAMSEAVANMAAGFNRQGMPVWLRFAWEMNGGWYEYGNDPENLKNAWISLTNKVRATTNETYMLWSPNVRYGETESIAGYEPYYPGEQYVDIAGLSYYSPAAGGEVASEGAFSRGLSSFYRLYGQQHPIILSETAAPYTYQVPASLQSTYCSDCGVRGALPEVDTLTPMPTGAADEAAMKIGWLNQIVSDQSAGRYPNLTAACFFNYFKYGNEHGGNAATLADFRNVGGHGETEDRFRQIVGNVSAYQGGYSGAATTSRTLEWRAAMAAVFFSLTMVLSM